MLEQLKKHLIKPALYTPGTGSLWDDEHISKGMLEAHLNPDWDAATRKHAFVDQSVRWIAQVAPPIQFRCLLDLGCGPGLYAERFSKAGYSVTGIDYSKRSIAYAEEAAARSQSEVAYRYQNYFTMDFSEQFDVITLIYCDYAVPSACERLNLLQKAYRALKPGGRFIFDVFTPRMRKEESHTWGYHEQGGFYSAQPHLCLESIYQYDDADQTELCQAIVVTGQTVQCYHIWDHYFTKEKLLSEIAPVPFGEIQFYGDVAGKAFSDEGETICVVLTK